MQFPGVSPPKNCCLLRFSRHRCQRAQRLSKTLHRDDAEIPCVAACLRRVIPSRNEEDVDASASGADHLLLDAADRADACRRARSRRSRRPGGRGRRLPRSSSTTSSAKASPAEGPPTPPRSISTLIGSLMSANCSTWMPTIGRPGSVGALDRADLDVPRPASRAHPQATRLARLVLRDQPAQVVGRAHGLAVDRDDHLGRLELARRGRVRIDGDDQRALGLGVDVVAELTSATAAATSASGPSAGLLARAARCCSTPGARAPPRARASAPSGRTPGKASRAGSPFGRSRPRSRSRRAVSFSPLTFTSARAAWRGPAGGDSCPKGASHAAPTAMHARATSPAPISARRASEQSPRQAAVDGDRRAVTYAASSEARKQTTSPTSRGRRSAAAGSSRGRPRSARPGRPRASRAVSIRPGAIELTVTPSGPTSRASVFAQPISAGPHRVREREVVDRLLDRARRDRDHASAAARLEVRQAETRRAGSPESSSSSTASRLPRRSRRAAPVRGGPPPLLTRMSIPPKARPSSRRAARGRPGS